MRLTRASLTLGNVPEVWWEIRVVVIPKTGTSSCDSSKDFRPINRTSFILKTVEKLEDRYLQDMALVEHSIHKDHYAYKMRRFTEMALQVGHHNNKETAGGQGLCPGLYAGH